jgi:hypothetical protein
MANEAPTGRRVRTPETDEVLRRVGRNVVLFQQIEYLLKFLNTHATYSGPVRQIAEGVERRAEIFHRKTMGDLANRLVDNVFTPPYDEHDPPEDIVEGWIQYRISFTTDVEFMAQHGEELRLEFRALVDARNNLIHHFLPRMHSAADGQSEEVLAYLDAQHLEGVRMKERLQAWARTVGSVWAHLATPEAEQEFELQFIRHSRLVVMLGEIAMQTPRADGWMLLSTAGQVIKRHAPEELVDLRNRFGHSVRRSSGSSRRRPTRAAPTG